MTNIQSFYLPFVISLYDDPLWSAWQTVYMRSIYIAHFLTDPGPKWSWIKIPDSPDEPTGAEEKNAIIGTRLTGQSNGKGSPTAPKNYVAQGVVGAFMGDTSVDRKSVV